jgi:hypothetical protein
MSLLANLTTDQSISAEKDSVGGGSYVLDSGIYNATVSLAYLNKSKSGALGMVLTLKTDTNREIRQTLWMTSGNDKGNKNYYEKDGERNYLPGFNLANSLSILTTGKEISALDTETKVVNVYSPEAKAEVPTKVEVPMDLIGKSVVVGLIKQTVDKTRRNESTGTYEPTGETRDENEIDKLFHAESRMTTAEIRAKAEAASFVNTWDGKWSGKVRDKSKAGSATQGSAGMPRVSAAAPSAAKRPTSSLFA